MDLHQVKRLFNSDNRSFVNETSNCLTVSAHVCVIEKKKQKEKQKKVEKSFYKNVWGKKHVMLK